MDKGSQGRITILVNSCDAYEDLWVPFFTLLKKYWDPEGVRVLLNTESKDFSFDGLKIECVHPENAGDPYGKRMIHALSQVRTPYVIPMLDDFFLRKKVDLELIGRIVDWMDKDRHIVYFNCDCTQTHYDYEVGVYPGFRRLPRGNEYILNMQAAVWRTEKLLGYWRPGVSPWEWETVTNLLAARNKKDKFYCVTDPRYAFCDYGYKYEGMGVYQGKWVKGDIVPLFERENILVDYSQRGFYEFKIPPQLTVEISEKLKTRFEPSELIERCLGKKETPGYLSFLKKNKALGMLRNHWDIIYVKYSLISEYKSFTYNRAIIERIKNILGFKRHG